jgi:hypothetical protein
VGYVAGIQKKKLGPDWKSSFHRKRFLMKIPFSTLSGKKFGGDIAGEGG